MSNWKEWLIVIAYLGILVGSIYLLWIIPDPMLQEEKMKLTRETELYLWGCSNSLFDRDSKIWPRESLLTKIQKTSQP